MSNQNNEELQKLLNVVSEKLGSSPEKVKESVQNNDFSEAFKNLNPQEARKLQQVLSDKEAAQKLLATEQAQKLLKIILGEK